jgi:hypothetical protein
MAGARATQYNVQAMISERLAKLETTLRDNDTIPEPTRQELLSLLTGLKAEVTPLLATHGDSAQAIAGSAESAVQASMKREEQPEHAAEAVEGLAASVRQFEATHPRLVEIVDQLALTLSNLGI